MFPDHSGSSDFESGSVVPVSNDGDFYVRPNYDSDDKVVENFCLRRCQNAVHAIGDALRICKLYGTNLVYSNPDREDKVEQRIKPLIGAQNPKIA